MEVGVSIIICCYNSALRLPETIKYLALQKIHSCKNIEIILINNASTDDTSIVATKEWSKYINCEIEFQVVDQPVPGLSNARHIGVEVSKYEYVVFCDDDNWLCENYIQTTIDILNSDERIAAVGGYGKAISNSDFPEWFEQYEAGYAVGKRGFKSGYLKGGYQLLTGAGLSFRKTLYLKAFSELPSLLADRKGNELSSGGDSEICLRFLLLGYRLYYDERLVYKHFIPSERLTIEYRVKLYAGFEQAAPYLRIYSTFIMTKEFGVIKKTIEVLKTLIKIPFIYFCQIRHWNYEEHVNYLYMLTGWSFKNVNPLYCKIKSTFLKY